MDHDKGLQDRKQCFVNFSGEGGHWGRDLKVEKGSHAQLGRTATARAIKGASPVYSRRLESREPGASLRPLSAMAGSQGWDLEHLFPDGRAVRPTEGICLDMQRQGTQSL